MFHRFSHQKHSFAKQAISDKVREVFGCLAQMEDVFWLKPVSHAQEQLKREAEEAHDDRVMSYQ